MKPKQSYSADYKRNESVWETVSFVAVNRTEALVVSYFVEFHFITILISGYAIRVG